MTDERIGDLLWPALRALPPGSGVVVRHHATPPAERRRLLRRVERIAAARRLVLLVGGGRAAHAGWQSVSWPAHDRREAIAGVRAGAAVLFVSPIYLTRSHPGAPALGPMRAARIGSNLWIKARPLALNLPKGYPCREGPTGLCRARRKRNGKISSSKPMIIALGGMTERRWRRIAHLGFDGWAAIDAWVTRARQKRKMVPT